MYTRLGRPAEAIPSYDEGLAKIDERTTTADTIWGMGMRALARQRAGDQAGALTSARGALALLNATQPVGYWVQQGTAPPPRCVPDHPRASRRDARRARAELIREAARRPRACASSPAAFRSAARTRRCGAGWKHS
jgi:hypothetical protein